MKTHTITTYLFSELSETAKQNAIQNLCDINVSHEWYDFILEDAKNIGLKITSFDLDRNRHAKGEFTRHASDVADLIVANHGKGCETYKTAEKFKEQWEPIFCEYMDENSDKYESSDAENEMQEIEEEFLSELLEDYSIMLQKEAEYLMSDEAIIETIEANGYEFTENGKLF